MHAGTGTCLPSGWLPVFDNCSDDGRGRSRGLAELSAENQLGTRRRVVVIVSERESMQTAVTTQWYLVVLVREITSITPPDFSYGVDAHICHYCLTSPSCSLTYLAN